MQSILANKGQTEISSDKKDITSKLPAVTIGIPVLNEEDHIERVISGFLQSDYPNLVEIIVADGGSTDQTKEIVKQLAASDERVKLISNQERFQSFALNKMIGLAQGDVFMRADAHCEYGDDYLSKCIEYLGMEGVRNVGGAARFVASNSFQGGTALSVLSFIGNGGAKHYSPDFEGVSDTVPMGCFYLEDLKKIGGFTESNHTNEDAEINQRIREDLNGKIYISKDIILRYYPRKNPALLFKQYFRYGRGRFLTSLLHKGKIPLRSKAPFLFISFLILYLLSDLLLIDQSLFSGSILGFSLLILLTESLRLSFSKRAYFKNEIWKASMDKLPGRLKLSGIIFIIFVIMHVGHFCGYGYQLIKMKVFNKSGW